MTPEEAVIARLKALAPVTALVSTRVYMLRLPQKPTLPAIRVQVIGEVSTYSHDGRDRLKRARVQIDAFAQEASGSDPYASAAAVADAIEGDGARAAATGLDGFQGDISSPAFRMRGAFRVGGRVASYDAGELRLVSIRQDYAIEFYA